MVEIKKNWLTRRILLPVAVITVFSTIITIGAVDHMIHDMAHEEFARDDAGIQQFWSLELLHHELKLEAISPPLMMDPALRQAFRTQDREGIRTALGDTFEQLRVASHLDLLTFIGPDLGVIYRAHLPERHGDQATLKVVERAQYYGTPGFGIDLGKNGRLSARLAIPWYEQGNLIGYVVVGENVDHLLEHVDQLFGMHHIAVLDTNYLKQLPHGEQFLQASDEACFQIPAHWIYSCTMERIPQPIITATQDHALAEQGANIIIESRGTRYYVGFIELKDINGEHFGGIITLRDITAMKARIDRTTLIINLLSVLLIAALLAFLWRVTRRAEDMTLNSYSKIKQARDQWNHSFDAINDPIFMHDKDYRIKRANRAYTEKAGMDYKAMIGKPYWEVFPRETGPMALCRQAMEETPDGGAGEEFSEPFNLDDGTQWVSRSFSVMDESGQYDYSIHILEDITERENLLLNLQRENRARRVISHSNRALVSADNEDTLLKTICNTIIEEGGYRLSWVAYCLDDERKSLVTTACAGIEKQDIDALGMTWDGTATNRTLGAEAIRSGQVQVSRDVLNDPRCETSHQLARDYQYQSGIAFPLKQGSHTFAVLFIAASERDAFNEDEVALLGELAGDMSYGLVSLQHQQLQARAEQARSEMLGKLENSLNKTVAAIASAVETRDPYTAGHQRHVAELAVAIAQELGLDAQRVEQIRIAATIHDVGKIYVPAEILSKPTRLSAVEFELIKTHSQVGYDIIKDIDFPGPIAEMVLQHHERLDGTGYPNGLKENDILFEARIIAVSDVFEAMSSHRPYRAALGIDIALEELERGKASAYDPEVVAACKRLFKDKGFTLESFFK